MVKEISEEDKDKPNCLLQFKHIQCERRWEKFCRALSKLRNFHVKIRIRGNGPDGIEKS